MEYRRFGSKIVARIDRGEELCAKVLELAREGGHTPRGRIRPRGEATT